LICEILIKDRKEPLVVGDYRSTNGSSNIFVKYKSSIYERNLKLTLKFLPQSTIYSQAISLVGKTVSVRLRAGKVKMMRDVVFVKESDSPLTLVAQGDLEDG